MFPSIPGLSFLANDELASTLSWIEDIFGYKQYTLRAIYHDTTVAPTAVPNDPGFASQWHLNGAYGINVQSTWDQYRGKGITIGFVDDGIQYTHPDIAADYNTAIDYDLETNTPDGAPRIASDKHGTTTGGMAAGVGGNALGITGVAYEATEANFRLPFALNLTDGQFATLYDKQLQAGIDVSNNSWGFGGFFDDNFNTTMPLLGASFQSLAANGRGGLGTNIVFAAGNGRAEGQNTNYHSLDNSQFVIAVAATDQNGKVTSFSTPGASLLLSAPGSNLTSTDRTGADGYVNGDYVGGLAGTSYSSPIVAGVVALMLDANPNLGYRDVQEILAYSSRNSDTANAGWKFNGATNWNGGGLHFSHDYGFGLVDAHAAVNLAETWLSSSTFANRSTLDAGTVTANSIIPDNNATGITSTLNVISNLLIDHVEVALNIAHANIGDLIVKLISPTGMLSTLVNRPGATTGLFGSSGSSNDDIHFTLMSNALWGETGNGQWKLNVVDANGGNVGTLQNWSLKLFGDTQTSDNTFIYTDEYSESRALSAARGTLADTNGGTDTLNLAAITSASTLSLIAGAASTIDGAAFTIAAGTVIENAILGDNNDRATGNDVANLISGGRGNDSLQGGFGNDTLRGDAGTDTAIFTGAFSGYSLSVVDGHTVSVLDILSSNGNEGSDTLIDIEKIQFSDGIYTFDGTSIIAPPPPPPNLAPDAKNDSASLSMNTSITISVLANDTDPELNALSVTGIPDSPDHGSAVINANNTITYTPTGGYSGADSFIYSISDGYGNSDTATVSLTINAVAEAPKNLTGTRNNDTLTGGTGNDTINAGRGDDSVSGNAGNDMLIGDYGNDNVDGGGGNDTIYGGYDNDVLKGGDGNDLIYGDVGSNTVTGGLGADTLVSTNAGTDRFVYEKLSDAGDLLQGFKRGQDKIDLHPLFVNIGYTGANPMSDGHMSLAVAPGGDLQLFIDADGIGGNAPVLLLTLDAINTNTLTLGTDYIV